MPGFGIEGRGTYAWMRLPETIIAMLLEEPMPTLAEATVRLPPRSTRWVAVFTGDEPGVQVARSTALTDRGAAIELARRWESEARERRRTVSHGISAPGTKIEPGGLSQDEVARRLNLSPRAVRAIERRALRKLRRHPALQSLWREIHRA